MIKPKIHAEDLTIFLVSGLILFSYGLYAILRTKFEQILRLKPLFCRGQDLFFQVRGRANFEKIARSLNHKL